MNESESKNRWRLWSGVIAIFIVGMIVGGLSATVLMRSHIVHIEERPVAEAAELLGRSVANVKVRAFRSRRKLRATLEKLIAERGGIK